MVGEGRVDNDECRYVYICRAESKGLKNGVLSCFSEPGKVCCWEIVFVEIVSDGGV